MGLQERAKMETIRKEVRGYSIDMDTAFYHLIVNAVRLSSKKSSLNIGPGPSTGMKRSLNNGNDNSDSIGSWYGRQNSQSTKKTRSTYGVPDSDQLNRQLSDYLGR